MHHTISYHRGAILIKGWKEFHSPSGARSKMGHFSSLIWVAHVCLNMKPKTIHIVSLNNKSEAQNLPTASRILN